MFCDVILFLQQRNAAIVGILALLQSRNFYGEQSTQVVFCFLLTSFATNTTPLGALFRTTLIGMV